LKEFNFALLGKWCLRCLLDREDLWYKVLSSRYGDKKGGGLKMVGEMGPLGGGRL